MNKSIAIVLRKKNERTFRWCEQIVRKQSKQMEASVHVVEEVPFFQAVLKTFEIGRGLNSTILLAIDADILLFDQAVNKIVSFANDKLNFDTFRVDYFVDDKFRGKQTAGVHLYSGEYLKDFLFFLESDDAVRDSLRPEYDNVKAFSEKRNLGYQIFSPFLVGKHDYCQYYTDIIQKYYLRKQRCLFDNSLDEAKQYLERCISFYPHDLDYRIALEVFQMDAALDIVTAMIFNRFSLVEKDPLTDTEMKQILKAQKEVGV